MDKIKLQLCRNFPFTLCDKITKQTKEVLKAKHLDCEANLLNAKTTYIVKNKYTYINVGKSGRYLIDNKTSEIYGIKGYGVINRNHFYGTLDTIDDYFWGDYQAYKIKVREVYKMENKIDYKMILQNYYNYSYSRDWLLGYLQCLYVNSLINRTELFELNCFIFNLK